MKSTKYITSLLLATVIIGYATAQDPDFGKSLIEAINLPPGEQRSKVVQSIFSTTALEHPGLPPILGILDRWHEAYAPMEFHHSEINEFKRPSGTVYVMHVYARGLKQVMYKDFQIYLNPNAPHKLEKIAFIAEVSEPINLPNASIDQPETLDWLVKYVDTLNKKYDLYGSFVVLKGNSPILNKQCGFEDAEKRIPITGNTLFNMASGAKMFTAVSIAQLVEDGKLNFADPITKYLAGFSDKVKAQTIKIRHLLSHTSGVNEYWSGQNNTDVFSATTIDQHLKLVYEAGLGFEAGTNYQYCNSNYILLGAVIEKITGLSFYDYVQKNIFDRAEMPSTGYFGHRPNKIATQLVRSDKGWIEGRAVAKGSSAGGAYSTIADIQNFAEALRNGTLIKKETLATMITIRNSGMNPSEDYGYGFILTNLGGEPGYGHGGTARGVNFEFDYYPQHDITIVLFCNQDNGAYDDLKKNIIKLVTGHR